MIAALELPGTFQSNDIERLFYYADRARPALVLTQAARVGLGDLEANMAEADAFLDVEEMFPLFGLPLRLAA